MLKILYIIYILDRVFTVFLSCVLKYMGLYHFAVWGMTRVSTSSALYCIGRNTEDAEMQGCGNDHAPIYIYIYVYHIYI